MATASAPSAAGILASPLALVVVGEWLLFLVLKLPGPLSRSGFPIEGISHVPGTLESGQSWAVAVDEPNCTLGEVCDPHSDSQLGVFLHLGPASRGGAGVAGQSMHSFLPPGASESEPVLGTLTPWHWNAHRGRAGPTGHRQASSPASPERAWRRRAGGL